MTTSRKKPIYPRVLVKSAEEEWRHPGQRGGVRVCLWLRLWCGHTDQRMVHAAKDGTFRAPSRVKCSECPPEGYKEIHE